jgi:hypothetical protein
VLNELEAAVEKQLPDDTGPARKRDGIFGSISKKAATAKRKYRESEELEEMRRKVQNIVDGFMVSRSLTLNKELVLKSHPCAFRYLLFFAMR